MKNLASLLFLSFLFSCASENDMVFNPDFNKYVNHVSVVNSNRDSVVYEYKDIRVDELAAIAALYCHEQGEKTAHLTTITLHNNNSRRAHFMCENKKVF